MSELSRTFSALSDDTRLALVERLIQRGEMPAGELATTVSISGPAVSRHLKVLRQAGVIRQRIQGTHRYYSACPEALKAVSDWTLDHKAFWQASLDRLEAALAIESKENPNG